MKDYYDILGVSREASDEDIKKAFRKLAHQHHPDKGGGDEAKFKEVNEAYQTLSNKEKRAQYDRFGQTFPGGGPGGAGFRWEDMAGAAGTNGDPFQSFQVDLGDLFGDVFGFGGQRRKSRGKGKAGRDMEMELSIEFDEAAFGTEKSFSLQRPVACPHCHGSGAEPGEGTKSCSTCNGAGQVERLQRTILGQFKTVAPCPTCDGKGSIPKKVCTRCRGGTVVTEERKVTVKVPAGIGDGQTIRLSGEGEAGTHGGPAGDLYLLVRVRPHSAFRRDGADVLSEITVSFSQAALGDEIEVPTLDGEMKVKIPAGTQSARVLRLRGKGAANLGDAGRGDHLLTVIVKTPEKLSKRAKELFKELGEE